MSSQTVELVVESSKSRSGRHAAYSNFFVYSRERGAIEPGERYAVGSQPARPTYARGWAKRVAASVKREDLIIYARFVRNFRGKVKGHIAVLSHRGELLFRAKYDGGALRRSAGNPAYAWLVRLFAERAKIPVTSASLGDAVA